MISRFLERFYSGDVAGIAELWDVPALVMGDQHVHGAMSLQHLRKLFADATLHQQPLSIQSTDCIEAVERLSRRVVMVQLDWPKQTLRGFLQAVEKTSFVLRTDQLNQLKIRALLLRGPAD